MSALNVVLGIADVVVTGALSWTLITRRIADLATAPTRADKRLATRQETGHAA